MIIQGEIMITQKELKEQVEYNPDTGVFTWKVSRVGVKKGTVCGGKMPNGYVNIKINYIKYGAHRLAILYVTGKMPVEVDHINHSTGDNRYVNLRSVTHQLNSRNRSLNKNSGSGFCGVSWVKLSDRWYSYVQVNGKSVNLGYYKTLIEAYEKQQLAGIPLTQADHNIRIKQQDIMEEGQQAIDEGPNREQTASIVQDAAVQRQ